jgi:hypothetical protein
MEGKFIISFAPPDARGRFTDITMSLEAPERLVMNHIYGAIVLLRDMLQTPAGEPITQQAFAEAIEEDIVPLFKKHPTEPVFPIWLKEREKEMADTIRLLDSFEKGGLTNARQIP